jgi:hypothetical protein
MRRSLWPLNLNRSSGSEWFVSISQVFPLLFDFVLHDLTILKHFFLCCDLYFVIIIRLLNMAVD